MALTTIKQDYENNIFKLNRIIKEKEDESFLINDKYNSARLELEKKINQHNLIIDDLQTENNLNKSQHLHIEKIYNENKSNIFNLESEIKMINEIVAKKDLIINEFEERISSMNNKIMALEKLNYELSKRLNDGKSQIPYMKSTYSYNSNERCNQYNKSRNSSEIISCKK